MKFRKYEWPRCQTTFTRFIHIAIACVTACFPFTSFGQSPEFRWARQGATGYHQVMDVAFDYQGNVYSVGTLNLLGTFIGSPALSYLNPPKGVFFLNKYDGFGNLLWSHQAGETEISLGSRCAVDAQGNIFVTGSFASPTLSFGGIILTNSGSINTFLAKFSPEGNLLWDRRAGGTDGADEPTGIAVGVSGNVYLSGSLGSTNAMFGNYLLSGPPATTNDVRSFLAKYDTNGSVVWVRQKAGFGAAGLGADAVENLYVLGSFISTTDLGGGIGLTNANGNDTIHTCLAKFDSMGNAVWARQLATGDPDSAYGATDFGSDLAVDRNGNSYLTGSFASTNAVFGGNTLTNHRFFDLFVAKLDSAGDFNWVRAVGGRGNDFSTGISTDAVGNCYVAGFYDSILLDFNGITLPGFSPFVETPYVAKYDAGGNVLWARKVSTMDSGRVHANAVASDEWGNLLLAGAIIYGSATFDDTTLTNTGFFVAKMDGPRLSGITAGNQLHLSWPTNAAGLHLESAASLSGPWSTITNSVVVNGNLNSVTIQTSNGSQFFRLNTP